MPRKPKTSTPDIRYAKPETRPIDKLQANPRNARKHPPDQIEQLRKSLRDYGWTIPALVDEKGLILVGHGRIEAAKLEGYTEASVVVARGWTDKQKRAYALLDNRVAEGAAWDMDMLRVEIGELQSLGFDPLDTGFNVPELGNIGIVGFTQDEVTARAEETPEPPKKAASKIGDLWICGKHRVLCGDSTNAEHVARLIGADAPNVMVTDPPYGVNYDPAWRNEMGIDGKGQLQRQSTNAEARARPMRARSLGKVENDDRADWRPAWDLFPGAVAYVWCASMTSDVAIASLEGSRFKRRAQIIWAKQHFCIGRGDYHWQHEPCWYVVRQGAKSSWAGDRKQTTVWNIANAGFGGDKEDGKTDHSTQKPVECMRRPIVNNSKRGDAVYDPFLGSGTTMIAAEMEGRRCLGLELSPAYVDVIVERWQNYANGVATLEGDGRTFAEVAASRRRERGRSRRKREDEVDTKIARKRLRDIKSGKDKLVVIP